MRRCGHFRSRGVSRPAQPRHGHLAMPGSGMRQAAAAIIARVFGISERTIWSTHVTFMILEKNLRFLIAGLVFLAPATTLVRARRHRLLLLPVICPCTGARLHEAISAGLEAVVQGVSVIHHRDARFHGAFAAQQAIDGYYLPREFDGMSRLALSLPIFLLLVKVPVKLPEGARLGLRVRRDRRGLWALDSAIHMTASEVERLGNDYTNPIPYGNTALLLGFLSAMSIRWDDRSQAARHPGQAARARGRRLRVVSVGHARRLARDTAFPGPVLAQFRLDQAKAALARGRGYRRDRDGGVARDPERSRAPDGHAGGFDAPRTGRPGRRQLDRRSSATVARVAAPFRGAPGAGRRKGQSSSRRSRRWRTRGRCRRSSSTSARIASFSRPSRNSAARACCAFC